jgi:hypothetical protein
MEMIQAPPLINHGIQIEKSHIRAHVGVAVRKVYVFRTLAALSALNSKTYPMRSAFQSGVKGETARGYLVPPEDIPDIRELSLKLWVPFWLKFNPHGTTTEKGAVAVEIVRELMKRGRFPIWIGADETSDKDIQIEGTDIILWCHQRVQVKCDWNAGNPDVSGCLFLQTAECNPLRRF